MSIYSFIHAFAVAPFSANTPVALIDASALTQVSIDDGAFVDNVYFSTDTFPSNGILSIGWSGNTDGVVPAAVGISTDALTAGYVSYNPTNVLYAPIGSKSLVLNCDSNVASGRVSVIIKTAKYSDFP